MSGAAVLFLFGALLSVTGPTGTVGQPITSRQKLLNGQRVYETNCAVCHGQNGNGRGAAAHMLVTQPRDFQPGNFKFRSTPSGALPTDNDLVKIITAGIRWTAMVGRADLTESERRAVVQYIKTFSPRFANEKLPSPIIISPEPARRQELVAQGRQLYRDSDCAKCHGERGDGKGISSSELTDDWGWPLPASDLTWRPLKRGSERRDVYLTIASGLNGTSMPAYAAALDGKQIWPLVDYLETLVPDAHKVSARDMLGEEQRGWMILRMQGMAGDGMMGR
jgi:mono/diheme cytochrome c family protein